MAPKDTELYDLLGVKPEATDIECVRCRHALRAATDQTG